MLRRRLRAEWAVVAVFACLFVTLAVARGWFDAADNRIYDLASGLAAPAADDRILIVEIDDPSLQQIGSWPWPRRIHARALDRIAAYGPSAIAYDVLFLDPADGDADLAAAIRRAGTVYLPAAVEEGRAGQEWVMPPLPTVGSGAAGIGIAQLLADHDGIVRHAERGLIIGGRPMAQLPELMARAAANARSPRHGHGDRFLIAYAGRHAFRRISFASLAAGEVPAALMQGKLVLIGATAAGMGDIHPVPTAAGSLLSGVEIQANVLNTILRQAEIATPGPAVLALAALVPMALLLAAYLWLSPGRNLLLAAVLGLGALGLSVALLALLRVWLPPTSTVVGLMLTHGLWGWRRLAATSGFVTAQAEALLREPGMIGPARLPPRGGDLIEAEAARLAAVIDQARLLRTFIARVVERFPDAVFVVDANDQVVLCNAAAAHLAGASQVGRPITTAIACISGDDPTIGVPLRHPSGQWLLMTEAAIGDGHRIVSFADITELQKAADERDDLLQFLSHDLRSPNAAIVWLLESQEIEDGAQPAEPLTQNSRDQIRAYARHGLRLADNFVQLVRARRRPLAQEPVDLSDVAREAADMVAAQARARRTQLHNASDAGEFWVLGDQGMLVRAVINLLENAIKFAPEDAQITYRVKRENDQITLSVIGPGPPMPYGREADPFALYAEGRVADGKGSIGLGLAFVRTTAQRHQGDATYAYHAGYGAEFEITLPQAPFDD